MSATLESLLWNTLEEIYLQFEIGQSFLWVEETRSHSLAMWVEAVRVKETLEFWGRMLVIGIE